MEQRNVVMTKDNAGVYQMLKNLLNQDKEFQIMITVPATGKEEDVQVVNTGSVKAPVKRDLERDVTDMIHELGVPAHIKGFGMQLKSHGIEEKWIRLMSCLDMAFRQERGNRPIRNLLL